MSIIDALKEVLNLYRNFNRKINNKKDLNTFSYSWIGKKSFWHAYYETFEWLWLWKILFKIKIYPFRKVSVETNGINSKVIGQARFGGPNTKAGINDRGIGDFNEA